MEIALVSCRLLLAAVFVVAAAGKLADPAGSRQAAREFGLGERFATWAGFLLPIVELAIAAALLPAGSAPSAAVAAVALLLAFSIAIAVNLARGRQPDCHCFGQLRSSPAGPAALLRNLALAAMAAFVAAGGGGDPGPSAVAWIANVDAETAAVLGLFLIGSGGAVWIVLMLLRQQGRLLLRVDALEAELRRQGISVPTAIDPATQALFVDGLPEGSAAPHFALPSATGDTRSLADLLAPGRPVVLVFSDPGCGPCRTLMGDVARSQHSLDHDVTIAVIGSGDPDGNRALADEYGIREMLLQDGDEISHAFAVRATPSAVLISAEGRVTGGVGQGAAAVASLFAQAARDRGWKQEDLVISGGPRESGYARPVESTGPVR